MEVAEPATHVEHGDPHFDNFFPFAVREGSREVPFSKSRVYRAHLRAWYRRPAADNAADVRRLLPLLKDLRKPDPRLEAAKNAPIPEELAALGIKAGDIRGKEELFVRSVTDALWFMEIKNDDDMLLWHIVADANLSPAHWRALRTHAPKLAFTVEHLIRPGVNRKPGRKEPGRKLTPSEKAAMRATAKQLIPQIERVKDYQRADLDELADQELDRIALSVTPKRRPADFVRLPAKEIINWFVAAKHGVGPLLTRKATAGLRSDMPPAADMRERATALREAIKKAHKTYRKANDDAALVAAAHKGISHEREASQQMAKIAGRLPEPLRRKLRIGPDQGIKEQREFVIWIVAHEFGVTFSHAKKILSRR